MGKHFLVSRTDAIGDVVLTLPLCGFLKSAFPDCTITFLGRTYTQPVVAHCTAIDRFINADDLFLLPPDEQVDLIRKTGADSCIHVYPVRALAILVKNAGIPLRIGTRNRWYHWFTCNKLIALSRKNSLLHEAELNFRLLEGLGISRVPAFQELYKYYAFSGPGIAADSTLADPAKFNLVLHPKSHGSGAEWSLERYSELISLLPANRFRVSISGSVKEKESLKHWIRTLPAEKVVDLTGMMTLEELITFFQSADGLIASGTGPLHLAAAAGIHTLGIFPASKPIHAGRWAPLGLKAEVISSPTDQVNEITAAEVFQRVNSWEK